MEALVMELFSDMENKDVVVADWEGHPLGQNQLQVGSCLISFLLALKQQLIP